MPSTSLAALCSPSRSLASVFLYLAPCAGSFDPESPLVMTTQTISHPALAQRARVPAMLNSWSSGCAWMLMARLGMYSFLVILIPLVLVDPLQDLPGGLFKRSMGCIKQLDLRLCINRPRFEPLVETDLVFDISLPAALTPGRSFLEPPGQKVIIANQTQ